MLDVIQLKSMLINQAENQRELQAVSQRWHAFAVIPRR
jgi:hypothetical protein